MKIAQVCPRYYPDIGGVETHVKEISERLVKRGFNVEVLCTDPANQLPEHEIIKGVNVTRFKSFAPADAYYFAPGIYFYLRNRSFDVIHAHSYHALPSLFAALAKNERRFVFTPHYHGGGHTPIRNLLHKPYRLMGSKIFERADRIICVSEYERRKIMSDFTLLEEKIEKIPNGLNLEEFKKIKREEHNREKTLLYAGRLEEYKGIQHMIQALPLLKDFKFEIIGRGPYENVLRKMAEKFGVSNRIKWYKNITREEMLQHYASADLFLMLSTHEAYGITVVEALASGLPCIVAMGSALEEFVDGERCMGIETPITPGRLIKVVQQIIKARAEVKKDTRPLPFADWDEVTDRLIEVYRKIS